MKHISLLLVLLAVLIVGVTWASLPPVDDGYVYKEDPCVEVMRTAMEMMEPFIPTKFKRAGELWHASEYLTEEGMQEREEAQRMWEEVKLQCFRH